MIKRFSKHQRVTLCLIQHTGFEEFNTWYVNARYLKQDKEYRYFTDDDKLYKINKQNNTVHILWSEIVFTGEQMEEWDEMQMFDFATCTNIVNGWQW